ncbi:dephospho-CoA kinase [Amedibacterium intestinale]|uniref:dephospho-CoA kinase n=1 Tax=Amedibacterium intestinale TaxID=2583452 RepID=UPI00296E6B11
MPAKTMKKIGLTGVMGAGKSSVIEILKQKQIPVLDCDAINASLLEKGEEGYTQIIAHFGSGLLDDDGNINKQKLSHEIFKNPLKKTQAEKILHPLIQKRIMQILNDLKKERIVVVEVPLLFEVHWESFFDEVWVVACEEQVLLERLVKYRHVDKEEAKIRLSHQLSQDEKIKRGDVILWNNGNKNDLYQKICAILEK